MFRQHPNQLQNFARLLFSALPTRSYVTKQPKTIPSLKLDEVAFPEELGPSFFSKKIGSNYFKWYRILHKHPELKSLKSKDVLNTVKVLQSINFSLNDILTKPMILHTNELTLWNRYIVLKECGIDVVTISLLSKYVTVMNRSVATLKTLGHIPYNLNVVEHLQNMFTDIKVQLPSENVCNETMELKRIRQHILNYYLQQRLGFAVEEVERLWNIYGRLKHKSFNSVQKIVAIVLDELKFPKERITKNAFVLYADADNVKRIIKEIPTIDGYDIKNILYKRPKIMMSPCDSLLATLRHIKSFHIGEDAVLKCLEVLTLGPDTVLERLKYINEIEELKVLNTNPRVLRLVHYRNKARLRLDYLNKLKVRCASLHILSCGSEVFAKFARDGTDRTKGRDVVIYLANILKKNEHDIRNLLSRHSNWCHIPAFQVKNCYEFLLSKRFTENDIYKNIHLLLYPINRINEKLRQLETPDFLEEFQIKRSVKFLTKNEMLTLVLYLIESEFHFTGDGIWTEEQTQHVENFNNLLPDFPESVKVYKYGKKPAGTVVSKSKNTVKEHRVNY